MKRKVLINLRKRKEKMYEFYYMVYGQMIKKRRLELDYTQEFVARAICSDTYISKAENSQVVIGEEQLYRIMEKLNIPRDEFGKPEALVYYLKKIINFFYYKDIESYKDLVEKVEGYQFHVVIEIIKLGYYILEEKYSEAKRISDQLIDYLSSMDDLAFSLYLIFSSILNVKLNKIKLAKHLIESVLILHTDYEELFSLYNYTRYIILGKLHMFVQAEKLYSEFSPKLINTYNFKLLKEVLVWRALFNEYNRDGENIEYLEQLTKGIDSYLVDEFLLIRGYNLSEPKKHLKLMKNKEHENYLLGLYFCAKQAFKNQNKELLVKYQKEISDLHYKVKSKVDYNNLLNLEIKNNLSFYKEYLINPCLKNAKEKQNIFFLEIITEEIVKILESRNRYKDALNYKEKLKSYMK